jgi:DNA-3-methyladenine glycosylase II
LPVPWKSRLAVAKESRASYAGERPAKHAKHTKRGSRSPFASFRVFRGHQSSSASVSDPWAAATAHLIKADPILAKIIREVGPCRLKRQKGGFAHLAQAIVNQQLSKAAADSIMKRLIAVAGSKHLTAESFQALSDKALKTAGISARKIGYLRDLAGKVIAGQLDFRRLPRLSDLPAASVAAQAGEEVIRELTQVKGIGRWTADLPVPCLSVNRQARQTGMYLIFVLCRPDVLPLDDTALRSSIADLYRLKTEGNVATIAATGDPWRPFRTVASWYLWSWRNGVSENARG